MKEAEIKRIAGKYKVPVGTVEKDYVLSLMLLILSNIGISSKIVFKGGTAIKKIYYQEARFSEDLDFNYFDTDVKTVKKLVNGIPNIDIFETVKFTRIKDENESEDSYNCRVNYTGPLNYKNSIKLDFSGKDQRFLKKMTYKPVIDDYESWNEGICVYMKNDICRVYLGGTQYQYRCELNKRHGFTTLSECWKCNMFTSGPEISEKNGLQTMNLEEILAEKCIALMMRSMPRDLHDICFLLEKEVNFDASLIKKKLERYEEDWNKVTFEDKIDTLKSSWERDLNSLLPEVPDFNLVVDLVKSKTRF